MTNTNIHNDPDPDARHSSPPPPPPPSHTHTHASMYQRPYVVVRHKHTLLYITIHVRYNGRTEKHYVKNAVRKMHLLYQQVQLHVISPTPLSLPSLSLSLSLSHTHTHTHTKHDTQMCTRPERGRQS